MRQFFQMGHLRYYFGTCIQSFGTLLPLCFWLSCCIIFPRFWARQPVSPLTAQVWEHSCKGNLRDVEMLQANEHVVAEINIIQQLLEACRLELPRSTTFLRLQWELGICPNLFGSRVMFLIISPRSPALQLGHRG